MKTTLLSFLFLLLFSGSYLEKNSQAYTDSNLQTSNYKLGEVQRASECISIPNATDAEVLIRDREGEGHSVTRKISLNIK